jgi:hypothetical protein
MPFLVYDLVPQKVVDAWSLMGKLVVLLWHTTIDDIESYLVCPPAMSFLLYYHA